MKITNPVAIIESLPSVSVNNWKTVQMVEQKSPEIHGLADIILNEKAQTIAAKATRKGLILQSPDTNNGDILVQGFLRIAVGSVVELPASNSVTITGTSGDVLYVGERL